MILAKTLLSILFSNVVLLSYLTFLRYFTNLKFSSKVMYIILIGTLLIIILAILLHLYLRKFLKYEIKRMEYKDIINISRIINLLPFLFSLLFVLLIFALGTYEFKINRNLTNFVEIVSSALPISFLTYYLTKFPLYELKQKGFSTFENKRFVSIMSKFLGVLIIHAIYSAIISILPLLSKSFSQAYYLFIIPILSFILFSFLFLSDIILRTKYIINMLRGGEFETKLPILSNDELDLVSSYIDGYIEKNETSVNFPYILLGNNKIHLSYGKGNYGCIWVKTEDTKRIFEKLSEEILEDTQKIYSKIESIAVKNKGFVYKFDGTECFILLGLDGSDWSESLVETVNALKELMYDEVYDKMSNFRVGISSGRLFVGWVKNVKGNDFYFFGEALIESNIVGRYPKEEGLFVSGDIKDIFDNTKFIEKIKIKEIDKIVEIHKLLI